jgi:hypothetical protein
MRVSLLFQLLTSLTLATGQNLTTHPLPGYGPTTIATDGSVYFTGSGTVTPGAAQTQPGGGTCYLEAFPIGLIPQSCSDAYVGKVDSAGNTVWGTLLGGSTADLGTAIAVDAAGNVYVGGTTGGSFPTTSNAAIATSASAGVFAAKISSDGSQILFATYLPIYGSSATADAISVDPSGNTVVVGRTNDLHAYAVKISADGSAFVYTQTLSGSNQERATAVLADASGNALIGGYTSSVDFPTLEAFQPKLSGGQDAFLTRIDPDGNVLSSRRYRSRLDRIHRARLVAEHLSRRRDRVHRFPDDARCFSIGPSRTPLEPRARRFFDQAISRRLDDRLLNLHSE